MSSAKVEIVATAPRESVTKTVPPSNHSEEDTASPPPAAPATPRGGSPRRPPADAGRADAREVADDPAWRIMSAFLRGWCVVWVLFAVLVVASDVMARHPQQPMVSVTAEDAQLLLEVSEVIVAACAYSNLDTAGGRAGCKALCRDHMCCFAGDDAWGASRGAYGCANDAGKMCPAHAGCESLVVSEDEAVIFDADGVAVFGDDASSGDYTSAGATATPPEQYPPYAAVTNTNSTSSTELELIRRVVAAVCADDNLRAHHGMRECAALCAPSLCCFDRGDIERRNPTLHLMLKLEAAPVDLAALGTCVDEEEGAADAPRHFCRVHAGCEHLLLFGAHGEGNQGGRSGETGDEQRRMLVTLCVFFGALMGVTAYLLVCQRHAASRADLRNETRDDADAGEEFARVGVV